QNPRYNHATQATPTEAGTLAKARVTSPSRRPSFFFGIVRTAMSEPSRPSYEFGPFLVDAGKRILLRSAEPVPLAPKVFETLLALIENRERVLTKDELLRQVWGDTSVEEGGLTRNVSILRKTLGEKPDDNQYIVRTPARGYQFGGRVGERGETEGALGGSLPAAPDEDSRPHGIPRAGRSLMLGGLAVLALVAM